MYATLAKDITVTIDKFHLYVPLLILDFETQLIRNESIKNSFSFSVDSWLKDRRFIGTELEYLVVLGSSQNINSHKYLLVVHQLAPRKGVPNKGNNIAVFNNIDVGRFFVGIVRIRHPRYSVSFNYAANDYLDQCKDLSMFL